MYRNPVYLGSPAADLSARHMPDATETEDTDGSCSFFFPPTGHAPSTAAAEYRRSGADAGPADCGPFPSSPASQSVAQGPNKRDAKPALVLAVSALVLAVVALGLAGRQIQSETSTHARIEQLERLLNSTQDAYAGRLGSQDKSNLPACFRTFRLTSLISAVRVKVKGVG